MQTFGLLYPGERQLLVFNFGPDLTNGNLLANTTPTVKITCIEGNDTDAPAVLSGAASVNAAPITLITPAGGKIVLPAQTAVQQAVIGPQIPNAQYIIEVNCESNVPQIWPTVAGRLIIGFP